MSVFLSKSKYCKGFQCPKMLWMENNKPEEADELNNDAVFSAGTRVGDLARGYFGEYCLVEYDSDLQKMVDKTREYLSRDPENIAEASFMYDGLFCAVDILHKNGDGWDIVEVKSSTHVSAIYIEDMAFQYYVLTNAGINVTGVYNMHIDNSYVFHESLDLHGLFKLKDCTRVCKKKFNEVKNNIESIRGIVDTSEEPEIEIGMFCDSPYECAYKSYCRRSIPYPSVFDISGLRKNKMFELYNQGIITYEDIINNGIKLGTYQMLQVETSLYHSQDYVDKAKIQAFLAELSYPIYHLDFETFQPAVPEWEGCRPFMRVPFQYSLHIEHEDGRLEHKEFLAKEGTDPRRAIAESLCENIPQGVCLLAYNMSFENGVLRDLAEQFPDLGKHLIDMVRNMHDLLVPFRKHFYYTEAMEGSSSIKYVLPALCPDDPDLDYHNLDQVHDGHEASSAFDNMAYLEPEEVESLRENLLRYCGLDTLAMVKVLSKLRDAVG